MMRLDRDGHVLLGGRILSVERMDLLGPEVELLFQNRGEPLGRFILTPTPGYEVPLQPRVVAVALADQVGVALRLQLHSASATHDERLQPGSCLLGRPGRKLKPHPADRVAADADSSGWDQKGLSQRGRRQRWER